MKKETHYIIRIKERNNPHIITTEFVGFKTKREVIDFYGLENEDVESYTIRIAGTPLIYGHNKAAAQ